MKSSIATIFKGALVVCLTIISFGCSSSSSDTPTTSVTGTVFAGPTTGATVTVKTAAGIVVARSGASSADGSYSVAIPTSSLANPLVFETSGGTFTDEATGTPGVALGTFSAYAAGGSLTTGSNVSIDPSSTIIQKLVAGGKTKTEAEGTFAAVFGYTPDSTIKPFPADTVSATDSQRLAGLRAAAFSKLTNTLGIPPEKQHELLQALAEDLADGVFNGIVTTASGTVIPVDISSRFASGLIAYNSTLGNKLTDDKIGTPPFAKTVLTTSYKVEYVPGMMAATAGKTNFNIKLTNLSDSTVASGKAIILTPKMYMSGMSHSAPVDPVVTDNGDGTYSCTVYYLMATMGGYWELKVNVGGEIATFYPSVGMSMGSTARATLKGVADVIGVMGMGTLPRTYYLFNEGVTGMGPYTFKLFIAAADDSMMMSFPAVFGSSGGSTLHDATDNPWTVNSGTSSVLVSSDGGSTWVTATDNGSGHWSAAGLEGVGAGGTIRVKVNINGEQKTTTGSVTLSVTNLDYAPFTISAGM